MELSIDVGVATSVSEFLTEIEEIDDETETSSGYALGVSAKRPVGKTNRHLFGFGVDFIEVSGQRLTGFRALDYQFKISKRIRLGTFFGAASLDSGEPQNGYYTGLNLSITDIYKNLGFKFEIKRSDGLARDRIEGEPQGSRPDIFIDIHSLSVSTFILF